MKHALHRFGKFYSRVILNFIGIFIFVGILSVLFGENGWIPNKDIYAISEFVYHYVLPVMIAYSAGNQVRAIDTQKSGKDLYAGGTIAVMATAGLLIAKVQVGLLGAMILGPVCGYMWKSMVEPVLRRKNIQVEMLVRNILVALMGLLMALLSYYGLAPLLEKVSQGLMAGIVFLIRHHLLFFMSFVIEPCKVFFLNNSINHGILMPLGMQQAERVGTSVLFLLETNPGPGLGLLFALYWHRRQRRKEYSAAMFVEFIGGIHEVYFPEILSNVPLLLSVIAGGTVGNLWFSEWNLGVASVVSPGSIVTLMMMSPKGQLLGILAGVLLSAMVSFFVAKWILVWQGAKEISKVPKEGQKEAECCNMSEIHKIGFICDAGVGSSSMGAALLRRKLKESGLDHVEVSAYAMDQIPQDLDLAVCQKNFKELLLKEYKDQKIITMDSLLNQQELSELAQMIRKRSESI
ncbi:MAG: hypothetical protein Q4D32_03050 [Eubacteriales bacterium]|nr:hypothetical protein [Eubacteriales bacterium]